MGAGHRTPDEAQGCRRRDTPGGGTVWLQMPKRREMPDGAKRRTARMPDGANAGRRECRTAPNAETARDAKRRQTTAKVTQTKPGPG